jgi:hypothetical protein
VVELATYRRSIQIPIQIELATDRRHTGRVALDREVPIRLRGVVFSFSSCEIIKERSALARERISPELRELAF